MTQVIWSKCQASFSWKSSQIPKQCFFLLLLTYVSLVFFTTLSNPKSSHRALSPSVSGLYKNKRQGVSVFLILFLFLYYWPIHLAWNKTPSQKSDSNSTPHRMTPQARFYTALIGGGTTFSQAGTNSCVPVSPAWCQHPQISHSRRLRHQITSQELTNNLISCLSN